jgi:hypothetical protein
MGIIVPALPKRDLSYDTVTLGQLSTNGKERFKVQLIP